MTGRLSQGALHETWQELAKTGAFFRRDMLVLLSYRAAIVTDWLSLAIQLFTFSFVGKLVDPTRLPAFGGDRVTYLEYVAIGIAVTSFVQVALAQVVTAIRDEQLMGTLESLLVTPTAPATVLLGVVVFNLAYVPLRTCIFLAMVQWLFGVNFDIGGMLPALVIILVVMPFVWGLGTMSAAGVLTFRRGGSVTGFGAVALTLTSGAYFPVEVLPGWLQPIARLNPLTVTVRSAREALLGDTTWTQTIRDAATLLPLGVAALALGILAFRLALARERKKGTLGLY